MYFFSLKIAAYAKTHEQTLIQSIVDIGKFVGFVGCITSMLVEITSL
jgi:hypothetical protein